MSNGVAVSLLLSPTPLPLSSNRHQNCAAESIVDPDGDNHQQRHPYCLTYPFLNTNRLPRFTRSLPPISSH